MSDDGSNSAAREGSNQPSDTEAGRLLPAVPSTIHDGKDEMNFAEFPLGVISKRTEPATKTLVFEDEIIDQKSGKPMKRRVTVSGTDDVGLPTSTDDDVLLALVQVAKLQKFLSKRVYFTRYHVLRILGWPPNGQNYKRLGIALERWQGVKVKYENAWRSDGTWAKEEYFHIIDNVQLNEESVLGAPENDPEQTAFEFATSWFQWNDVVFKSFQSSNLKSLDFAAVMALNSAISRRLYRFLDKRFYQRSRLEFDLRTLAYEHIGFARSTPINEVKRQVSDAIDELENCGFLRRLEKKERFKKESVGVWRVVFEKWIQSDALLDLAGKKTAEDKTEPNETRSPLEQKLCDAGVRLESARDIIAIYPAEHIETKLEALDYLIRSKAAAVSLNPAGYLIKSIEQNYDSPKGFVSSAFKKQQLEKEQKQRDRKVQDERAKEDLLKAKRDEEDALIAQYWDSLSATERKKQEREATATPNQFEQTALLAGGEHGELVRQMMMGRYALQRIKERGEAASSQAVSA